MGDNNDACPTAGPAAGNLEDSSGCFSYLLMMWLDRLFATGAKRTLEAHDLGGISDQDRADVLSERFSSEYDAECRAHACVKRRSLWAIMFRTIGYARFVAATALFCVNAAVQFGPVFILTKLVRNSQGVEVYSAASLWGMVALLFVFPVFGSLCLAHSNALMAHLGAQVRNTLICAIYRKTLKISQFQKMSWSTGRILTMFADDTNQIRVFIYLATNTIVSPLSIAACLYLIWEQVGVSTLVGLAYLVCTLPISGGVFAVIYSLRARKMKFTDSRVKLMNEILNGIRCIKYFAWERPFAKKIGEIRSKEVALVAQSGYILNAAFGLLLLGATQLQCVLIFFTFIALGNQLDAAIAFTTITLFGLMSSPFIFLPYGITAFNIALISMSRIMEFLGSDDVAPYIDGGDGGGCGGGDEHQVVIAFRGANLSWSPESLQNLQEPASIGAAAAETVSPDPSPAPTSNRAHNTLMDISLTIRAGQLVGIVGPVGCGKSSLLCALLGEMVLRSGRISILPKARSSEEGPEAACAQTVAYCDQRPWIINATVEDNITFGLPLDEARMRRAVSAACIDEDLGLLPAGLHTEIGEKGVTLSGGQRARVALARAVYSDGDIYLMDDILAAVDAHVGARLVDRCILGALAGKTRLLVTNHLPMLPLCDLVVILEADGTIKAAGSFEEIMASGIDVSEYVRQVDGGATPKSAEEEEGVKETDVPPGVKEAEVPPGSGSHQRRAGLQTEESKEGAAEDSPTGALTTVEEKCEGSVSLSAYFSYIEHGGVWVFAAVVLFQLASQVLGLVANFWLAQWGKETSIDNLVLHVDMPPSRAFFWFNAYAGMQIGSIFSLFLSRMLLTYHRTEASKRFHDGLLWTVLFLPVSFHDVTPLGRVVNRFSQDTASIDEDLVQSISQIIGFGGGVLGCLGAIAGSTQGTFLVLLVPLGLLYWRFQSYFRASNTAIARIEAVSRSPIYADFSQTISGITTIRAYRHEERYINRLEHLANRNTIPGVLQQIASQWLGIRLDFLGAVIMFFMGALTVALQGTKFIPAGWLALGLSYAIQLTGLLKLGVRAVSVMEAQFNSVERVNYYTELEGVEEGGGRDASSTSGKREGKQQPPAAGASLDVEQQGGLGWGGASSSCLLPADWPRTGKIRFEGVEMRYRDQPLVLKGVNFEVADGEKMGICGRTGCGKSSLLVALFRIEPLCGGRILIDDVDIATVPLQLLRSKLCIIPQETVMFSATLKFNIDPLGQHTDDEVWGALRAVDLEDHVRSLPGGLDELVSEGGSNWSAGQRQLMCIARACLRKPRVLVMDEATSSIDAHTDASIQSMISKSFAGSSVLCVAHRLNTIVDCDKILVLDGGRVGEYGPPQSLLLDGDGLFSGLWRQHVGGASPPIHSALIR